MINIKDIEARYKRNPEPQEVKDLRKLITESFSKLEFVEEGHKYYLPMEDGTKKELQSVSHFTHTFEPQDDWDAITRNYARKHNRTFEDVKKEWHENNITSTTRGTKTHYYGEMMMNLFIGKVDLVKESMPMSWEDGYLIPYCPKEEAILKYYEEILHNDNVYPIMPETRVYTNMNNTYDFKIGIAGTFDILLAYRMGGKIKVALHDFKTNGCLYNYYNKGYRLPTWWTSEQKASFERVGIDNLNQRTLEQELRLINMGLFHTDEDACQEHIINIPYQPENAKKLLPPFDNLVIEPKSMYTLQLSTYQMMLSQLPDLDIVDRRLIWLKDDGDYQKVAVGDVSQKIIDYCCK